MSEDRPARRVVIYAVSTLRPAYLHAARMPSRSTRQRAGRQDAVAVEKFGAWETHVDGLDELGSDEPGVDDVAPEERARQEAVNLLTGAPRGLPACMKVKWWTLVADARLLIEAGADINKATDDGVTPLTPLLIAGHFGNEAIVQILKDAGAA